MRNVAMFSSGNGVHKEFEKAWPIGGSNGKKEKEYFTVDEEMRETIKRIHNINI